MNYYNEIELSARRWLRELIRDGLIPDGFIDNRPIQEVKAEELIKEGFAQCHFFAGIGGWSLALRISGVPDDQPLWTGSCPCQPFSDSGDKMGFSDPRHLFPAFRRLIARGRPSVVIGEQVASKLGREWLARVRSEMAYLGYATGGGDLCSAGVAAPNLRQRLFWMAYAENFGRERRNARTGIHESIELKRQSTTCALADADGGKPSNREEQCRGQHGQFAQDRGTGGLGNTNVTGLQGRGLLLGKESGQQSPWSSGVIGLKCTDGKTRRIKPEIFPLASRIPGDLGLIRGAGNAINPWIAAKFIESQIN